MSAAVGGSASERTPQRVPGTIVAGTVLLIVGAFAFAGFGLFYLIGGIIDLSVGISGAPVALTVIGVGVALCVLAAGLIPPAAGLLRGSRRARLFVSLCAGIGIALVLLATIFTLGAASLLSIGAIAEAAILIVGVSLLRSGAGPVGHFTR